MPTIITETVNCNFNQFQVAAQKWRKRKIDQMAQLEHQVEEARLRKERLIDERRQLYRQRQEWAHKLSEVEHDLLKGLNKNVNEFALDAMGPEIRVVRRDAQAQAAAAGAAGAAREHVSKSVIQNIKTFS